MTVAVRALEALRSFAPDVLHVHEPLSPGCNYAALVGTDLPAVGTFQPRSEAKAGARVRSGDRLGAVDMLGVPQDVVAPADGIVGASLVDAGEAVEYGQELIVIELAGRPGDRSAEPATDRAEA